MPKRRMHCMSKFHCLCRTRFTSCPGGPHRSDRWPRRHVSLPLGHFQTQKVVSLLYPADVLSSLRLRTAPFAPSELWRATAGDEVCLEDRAPVRGAGLGRPGPIEHFIYSKRGSPSAVSLPKHSYSEYLSCEQLYECSAGCSLLFLHLAPCGGAVVPPSTYFDIVARCGVCQSMQHHHSFHLHEYHVINHS
jgi:hypothetical protein